MRRLTARSFDNSVRQWPARSSLILSNSICCNVDFGKNFMKRLLYAAKLMRYRRWNAGYINCLSVLPDTLRLVHNQFFETGIWIRLAADVYAFIALDHQFHGGINDTAIQ